MQTMEKYQLVILVNVDFPSEFDVYRVLGIQPEGFDS